LIEPTNTEHGEIEAELNADTTLNESVGINDENRTPANPIDDVFTVVKQKDFIHQGSTLYSFEFESEASQEQVDKWREHDSERAAVYPSGETDVGNQSLEVGDAAAQTTSSSDNNYDNGKAQTTSSSEAGTAKAQTSSSTTISTEDADDVNEPDIDSFTFNESLDGSGWDQLDNGSGKNTVTIQGDGLYHLVVLQFEISSDTDMDIAIVQDSTVIRHISPQQVGTQDSFTITNQTGQNHLRRAFYVPVDPFTTGSYDYECHISTKGGGTPTVDGRFQAFVRNHSHGASTTTTDSGHGDPSDPSTHSVSTSTTDSGHGGKGEDGDHNVTTSTTTTDSGHGSSNTDPHGGSTEDNVNVTTVNEDKTDR